MNCQVSAGSSFGGKLHQRSASSQSRPKWWQNSAPQEADVTAAHSRSHVQSMGASTSVGTSSCSVDSATHRAWRHRREPDPDPDGMGGGFKRDVILLLGKRSFHQHILKHLHTVKEITLGASLCIGLTNKCCTSSRSEKATFQPSGSTLKRLWTKQDDKTRLKPFLVNLGKI